MSSVNWAEVPGGKGLASIVSKLETTAYLALLFPSKTKLLNQCIRFPQDWSEDLLTIPLMVLSSGPKFLGKSEKGESSGLGRRVAGLRTSQKDIIKPRFSMSTT